MYWKSGFYNTCIEGGVEITKEYWLLLLDGQSAGKEIVEDDKGYPILQEHMITLDEARNNMLFNIRTFDKSEDVNSFILMGDSVWLDKELRASIRNTVGIKRTKGIQMSSIWYNHKEYILPIDYILNMLDDVEIYADACNGITQRHISNIYTMDNIEDIENYNYKNNYPTKLRFDYHEESIL